MSKIEIAIYLIIYRPDLWSMHFKCLGSLKSQNLFDLISRSHGIARSPSDWKVASSNPGLGRSFSIFFFSKWDKNWVFAWLSIHYIINVTDFFFLELLKKNLNSSPQLSHCTHLNKQFFFFKFQLFEYFFLFTKKISATQMVSSLFAYLVTLYWVQLRLTQCCAVRARQACVTESTETM